MAGVENLDFVKCVICGYASKKLGNHLLKNHSMTSGQYHVQYPGMSVTCNSTASNLSASHKGRVNWVARMKKDGKQEELHAKVVGMAQRVSDTVTANSEERKRRSDTLTTLNKTNKFRSKASETAIKTSSRIDILLARSERLRQWREENPQVFYEKCTSQMVKMQSSKPEKALAAAVRAMFPEQEFRSSQKLYHSQFTTVSKQRQIDIFSKEIGIAIEFDGPVHFKNIPSWNQLEDVRYRDTEVNCILQNEFLLIRVSHDQWHSKKGFSESCLNQIKQEINLHLNVASPRLVQIGWAYQ